MSYRESIELSILLDAILSVLKCQTDFNRIEIGTEKVKLRVNGPKIKI